MLPCRDNVSVPVAFLSQYGKSKRISFFQRNGCFNLFSMPYLYSRYWTGTSLQLRLTRAVFSYANYIYLLLMIFRMSLDCTLVPVQHREYDYGLLDVVRLARLD